MARFRVGNASGNPWTGVSPNQTASSMTALEAQMNASVIDQIESADFATGIYPWLNPYDFGATGVQGEDASAAFQAMVDSIPESGGAIIVIPPGIHSLTTAINVTKRATAWLGSGGNSICDVRCAAGFLNVNLDGMDPGSNRNNPAFIVRDLRIFSTEDSTDVAVPTSTAIKFVGEHNSLTGIGSGAVIENVHISGLTTSDGFKVGIDIDNAQQCSIRRCSIIGVFTTTAGGAYKNMEHAIVVRGFSTQFHIEGCWVNSAETAFGMVDATDTSEDLKVMNCTVTQCDYGVDTVVAAGGVQTVRDSHFATFLYGVRMANDLAVMSGNLFFKRSDALAAQDYIGIECDGSWNTIVNNQFLNGSVAGGLATAIFLNKSAPSAIGDYDYVAGNTFLQTSGGWTKTIELNSTTKYNTVESNTAYPAAPAIVNSGANNCIREWGPKTVPTLASSAGAITLPVGHDLVKISGVAAITSITATYAGHVVTLIATAAFTIADGSNLKLSAAWAPNADDTLTLACDGTDWFERSRSAN